MLRVPPQETIAGLKVEVAAEKAALVSTCLELGEREKEIARLKSTLDDQAELAAELERAREELATREHLVRVPRAS